MDGFFFGLGFDGCHTNTGKDTGVNKRMRDIYLWDLVAEIHCGSHKASITSHRLFQSKDGNINIPSFISMLTTINVIIRKICNSPVNKSILKKAQEIEGLKSYALLFTPKARFDFAYDTIRRFFLLLPDIRTTCAEILDKKQYGRTPKVKAEFEAAIETIQTNLFVYKLRVSVQLLEPMKALSKQTQFASSMITETQQKVQVTIRELETEGSYTDEKFLKALLDDEIKEIWIDRLVPWKKGQGNEMKEVQVKVTDPKQLRYKRCHIHLVSCS